MLGLFRKTPPVLQVFVGDSTICEIGAPAEECPTVRFSEQHPILRFVDSRGTTYSHDLQSVVQEGFTWALFSISVTKGLACQADAILMKSEGDAKAIYNAHQTSGIRFQPFYLPGCRSEPSQLVGRGLFFRGLHYSGTITPGFVSLSCICDSCHRSFRLQSFHAGFGGHSYFYCSNGPHTLIMNDTVDGAPPALGEAEPVSLAKLEARLPACSRCGGGFAYQNPFRCPHCSAPYIDFLRYPKDREVEYYGNYLYGEEPQKFE